MAKWEDIAIEKPKERPKYSIPFKQEFNEYGFGYDTSMYSLPEENRDFRKSIQNEIVMEHVRTQNVLGNHITDEIDRNIDNTDERATEIKQKIDNHHTYVVNTVKPELDTIKTNTENIKATQAAHTTTLENIWNNVRSLVNVVMG